MWFSLPLFLVASLSGLAFADVHSLSGLQWSLHNQNGSIVVPGSVPSQVHLDLAKAGVITEPLLGINDFTERWVINDNWTYTADLTPLTHNITSDTKTLLVFYGIDTIANITFAGEPLAWVSNQFQQYTYDVSNLISHNGKDNNLTVSLESAYFYGLNVTSRPDAEISPTPDFEYTGIRQFIRKTQSDFGWDWGPAFVPSGIFKPAYLITLPTTSSAPSSSEPASHPLLVSSGSSPVFIEESALEILKRGQNAAPTVPPNESAPWVVNVTLALRSSVALDSPSITVDFPELKVKSAPLKIPNIPASVTKPTFVNVHFEIPDNVPQRWYPHNLGTPKLYNATVALSFTRDQQHVSAQQNDTDVKPQDSLSFTTRTGFRTIQLIQTPYSQADVQNRGITPGDQWHFEINGKAFYSSGTNIIPFDPFYARMTTEQVRWILESAVLSGQNMLRVWGGGIYQPSDELTGGYDFYSACDELGILAWSELIFSDALYPINDFLLESIEPEVRQNVRRVKRHPSNAQWAGGNEIEGIVLVVEAALPNGTHYLNEYQTLFGEFLHDIVYQEQSSVAYTDCSTTHGVLSLDPYVIRYANASPGAIYGNGERYNYDAASAFDYSTYPRSRFMNEFGFHSMPSFYSWEEALTSPSDFSFNSPVVVSRDHHPPAGSLAFPNPNAPQGQQQMQSAVLLWLPAPSMNSTSNHTFAQWCFSTQVFQSLNMVSEIAFYRRGSGLGENNLGALVWQLNDIWQGVSWSAIEYSGRWKVLQYGMTSAFSPLLVYPFWTASSETLEVRVISDRLEPVQNVNVELTWYEWSGKKISSQSLQTNVGPLNGSVVWHGSGLVQNILPKGSKKENVFLHLNLTARVEGKTITNEQVFTPTSLATGIVTLPDPQISLTHNADLTFTLSARGGVAAFAWIDHPAGTVGYFVDTRTGLPSNGFYLIPGSNRTLRFVINASLSKVKTPNPSDFVIRSLFDNTHE